MDRKMVLDPRYRSGPSPNYNRPSRTFISALLFMTCLPSRLSAFSTGTGCLQGPTAITNLPACRMKCTSLASQRESKVDSSESKMKIGGLASNNSTQSAIFESASDGFGESVPYVPLNQCSVPANQCIEKVSSIDLDKSNAADSIDEVEILKRNRLRNIAVATASFVYAIFNYGWQLTHPVTAVEILATMQSQSAPLTAIGNNGKPTVIDFWAPWCENCKVAAPTLKAVEEEYGDQVNFIMVNGDDAANWPLIELFGVDAIPHLALVNGKGDVETALIGPMSRNVLRADINALLTDREDCEVVPVCHDELPYIMYDAFGNRPDSRRINFAQQ